jgi:hypothetical protein
VARISKALDDQGLPVLDVVLSERNLLVLWSKLYTPGSRCEFHNNDCPSDVAYVRLRAEKDDEHYASPTRLGAQGWAGAMHPVTEAIVAVARQAIAAAVEEFGGIDQPDRPDRPESPLL